MPGAPREEAEHSLDLNEKAQPIKQRLRRCAQDRKEAIRVEVTRLLAAGFIREVTHPEWLANQLIVKKKNGEWRMCVDYTDCWHFLSRYRVCEDLGSNLRIACWRSLVQSLEMRALNPS